MQLSGHTDNHVIIVWVKAFSLGHIHAEWGLEVIACANVVNIVNSSRSKSDLGEISRPNSLVGVLSLILGEVG